MSAFDWSKLESFFPGCTHAAIDPFGMLVVMKVEAGEPFFHSANRWVPGEKGVRKDYGLTGAYGPDFSPQSTLEANPGRQAEIYAARQRGSGVVPDARRPGGPGYAAGPTAAPTLNEIQNNPDLYQRPQAGGPPAVVDGMVADHIIAGERGHFGTKGEMGDPLREPSPTPPAPAPAPAATPPALALANLLDRDAKLALLTEIEGVALAYTTIHGPAEKHQEIKAKLTSLRELIEREPYK
jgi:hypothetical protein